MPAGNDPVRVSPGLSREQISKNSTLMRFLSLRLLVLLGIVWVQHGDAPPLVFELDVGQAKEIRVPGPGGEVRRVVRLLQVEESRWPNWHLAEAPGHAVLRAAEVQVEVGGTRATLWARPFEPPRLVDGLRLYVESTHTWATTSQLDPLVGMTQHVRMSCVAEGMPWGPPELRFPIARFRWQANTYGNTWGALVPYNKLYYHRGEDFGAIPDELEVVASLGGTVIQSPLPDGDGDSNHLRIRHAAGLECAYYHMNLETIPSGLTEGVVVGAGQRLGRTGMTWDGRRSQVNDPHLHWGVFRDGQPLASYPFVLEAYLRDYPDSVLAVAGGYHYAMPGEPVELDASRSVARPGRRIVRHRWLLHDGREVEAAQAVVRADRPGLYCEELRVWADDGSEDRDYVQLRVWDRERGGRMGAGWLYHSPVRGGRPGEPVRFWNRLWGTTAPVTLEFGDGSPATQVEAETTHVYATPGRYTARLSSLGPDREPLEVRMQVVIE